MRRAGQVVAEMHERIRAAIRPGVTTLDLDAIGREVIERRGARSNFLGYHGFPAVICASPNDVIVHGIPDGRVLEEGDIGDGGDPAQRDGARDASGPTDDASAAALQVQTSPRSATAPTGAA